MSLSLCFIVSEEEEEVGGFTAAARIPNTKSTLRTEGDSLTNLYKNIVEVVEGYCESEEIPIPSNIKVILPAIPSSLKNSNLVIEVGSGIAC
jgi:hypothetical protein